jgi:2-oxoglutarate ferredoxin oxidoreductase subunit delta
MKASPSKRAAKEIKIDNQFCKGCGLCIQVCPRKVFGKSDMRSRAGYSLPRILALENCGVCLLCEMTCPDLALTVVEEKK